MTAAVAVASMSPHQLSQQGSHFIEQPEDLLDKLLRACEPKPAVKHLPGFGRDLQPYFSPEVVSAVADAQPRRSRGNKSPHKGASALPKQATSKKLPNKKPSGEERAAHSKQAATVYAPPVEDVGSILNSWAGPGFYNTPLPEHLPMPSSVLLG